MHIASCKHGESVVRVNPTRPIIFFPCSLDVFCLFSNISSDSVSGKVVCEDADLQMRTDDDDVIFRSSFNHPVLVSVSDGLMCYGPR